MAENTGLLSADVSAGDDANASQYNNLRADTKKMRQEEMTAGATINGATLPVPVYQNTTDNEVYACDADDTDKLNFLGFAITDAIDAGAIIVQHTGIVGGFTGLDEGEKYYVQDTAGTIGKTPGTYAILVGVAISATELLIDKKKYFHSYEVKAVNTEYQAFTDGFIVASLNNMPNDTAGTFDITVGSASPPTNIVCSQYTSTNIKGSLTFPIKRGWYWKVNSSGTATPDVYFIPAN